MSDPQWAIYDAGWDDTARFRVAVCGRRFGKALAVSTRLRSPDGWTTMGAIRVGNRLFDERGAACEVKATTEVMFNRPCNRVCFDDHTEAVVDDDHLWKVVESYGPLQRCAVSTTHDIAWRLRDPGYRCTIPACHALQLPDCISQGDPYSIGRLAGSTGFVGLSRALATGSIEHRNRLLQGAFETKSGHEQNGFYWLQYTTAAFARCMLELLRSLGHVPRVGIQPDAKHRGYWIHWNCNNKNAARNLISVEPIESVPVRCIQVDSPSRLYLCGSGMIPTHNTFLMAEEIRRAARLAIRFNIGVENEIWYGAPTFLQAKRVMWGRLKKSIPSRWLDGPPNETNCVMRLRSGHIIRIVGLDAFENLRGSGLWFFGGDEWADCRPEAWLEVVRPMLSTSRGHALFIGTPKGFDHFRDAYLLGQPGGNPTYRSFLFTTLDGGNVPADEVAAAQQQLDPRTFRQEYGASFESYAGRVVYAFSRAESIQSQLYDPSRALHVGMDFNINPMSATIWQERGEITQQIDEIIMPTSNTDEMASELSRRYGRAGFDPSIRTVDHITVYPDPDGAQRRSSAGGRTDIGILRAAGLRVVSMAAHPSVRDRSNVMNQQFLAADGTRRAFVDPSCVKSIEAYERLVYREGTNEPDKSQGQDHLVDASGYYLYFRTLRQGSGSAPVSHIMER